MELLEFLTMALLAICTGAVALNIFATNAPGESDAGTTTCITFTFPGDESSSNTWDGGTMTDFPATSSPSTAAYPTETIQDRDA
ncbi:hypothetical protein CPB85DRAFT_1350456 [Mucidula mucida]|nr:hypothetical protein CPB85DRAFT_1350456 [Mucidula mucida]